MTSPSTDDDAVADPEDDGGGLGDDRGEESEEQRLVDAGGVDVPGGIEAAREEAEANEELAAHVRGGKPVPKPPTWTLTKRCSTSAASHPAPMRAPISLRRPARAPVGDDRGHHLAGRDERVPVLGRRARPAGAPAR